MITGLFNKAVSNVEVIKQNKKLFKYSSHGIIRMLYLPTSIQDINHFHLS